MLLLLLFLFPSWLSQSQPFLQLLFSAVPVLCATFRHALCVFEVQNLLVVLTVVAVAVAEGRWLLLLLLQVLCHSEGLPYFQGTVMVVFVGLLFLLFSYLPRLLQVFYYGCGCVLSCDSSLLCRDDGHGGGDCGDFGYGCCDDCGDDDDGVDDYHCRCRCRCCRSFCLSFCLFPFSVIISQVKRVV